MIKNRLKESKTLLYNENTIRCLGFAFGYVLLLNIFSLLVFPKIFIGSYGNAYALYYNFLRHLLGILCSLLVCFHFSLCLNRKRFSDIILALLDFLYFIPGIIHNSLTKCQLSYFLYFLCYCFIVILINELIPQTKGLISKIPIEKLRTKLFPVMCVVIALFSVGVTIYLMIRKGVTLDNLLDIYANRSLYKSLNMHWLFTSVLNFLSTIIPVLVTWALLKKKYFFAVMFSFCQCLVFLNGSNRIIIFNLGMAIFIGLFNTDSKRFTKVFACVMLLCFFEFAIGRSVFVSDVLRRTIYVPNIISEWYYDYFLQPEHSYDWAISQFPRIARLLKIASPYSKVTIAETIGHYFSSEETVANTGLAGGGFAMFGWLGVILSPLVYVLSFRYIDSVTERFKNNAFKVSIAIIITNNVINANAFASSLIKPYSSTFLFLCCLMFVPAIENSLGIPDKRIGNILTRLAGISSRTAGKVRNVFVKKVSDRYKRNTEYSDNTVLFVSFTDMKRSESGSGIRPKKMYEAFRKKGYNTMLLCGAQRPFSKRAKAVKKIITQLKTIRPDFCYIESDVLPILGLWDRILILRLHLYGIKTGYFMRDAYFLRGNVAMLNTRTGVKRVLFGLRNYICTVLSVVDEYFLSKYVTTVYVVSQSVANSLGFPKTVLLPPAADNSLPQTAYHGKSCIYVGGLSYRYGTDLIIDAFNEINKDNIAIPLTLVCREAEYKNEGSPKYPWLTVMHVSGKQLEPLYSKAAVGIIALRPTEYNDFAIPVKYYEYIGHGLPVVAVNSTELANIIGLEHTGVICESDANSLAEAIMNIFSQPEEFENYKNNVKKSLANNLWTSRVDTIASDLAE